MDNEPLNEVPFDCLLASLCYLMSRYALKRDLRLAEAVSKHLAMLPRHPGCRSAVLADLGQRLAPCWLSLARGATSSAEGKHRCH